MSDKRALGLYIHIPFCVRKCLYCDFLSFTAGNAEIAKYVQYLVQEIRLWGKLLGNYPYHIISIFFGGGTPSLLPENCIALIMETVRDSFDVSKNAEITIEANPGTISKAKALEYISNGINRVSLGLQSVHDDELLTLGRIHTYNDFLKSYDVLKGAGFDNINIDLMSAIPGQSLSSWQDCLQKTVLLKPEHISAYSLMIEENTPFFDMELKLPSEDEDREMYHFTKSFLCEHGYNRYEISNYSRPGYECRHNIGYWTRREYLGLGLGSSSLIGSCRFKNTESITTYYSTIKSASNSDLPRVDLNSIDTLSDTLPIENINVLTKAEQMEEFMFLGLRLCCGVNDADFSKCFKCNIRDVYPNVMDKLIQKGLLTGSHDSYALTETGIDISNVVLSEFLFD